MEQVAEVLNSSGPALVKLCVVLCSSLPSVMQLATCFLIDSLESLGSLPIDSRESIGALPRQGVNFVFDLEHGDGHAKFGEEAGADCTITLVDADGANCVEYTGLPHKL